MKLLCFVLGLIAGVVLTDQYPTESAQALEYIYNGWDAVVASTESAVKE